MTTRRGFLATLLAAGVAPAAVGSSILMPVRPLGGEILLPSWLGVDLASGPDLSVYELRSYGESVGVPPPEMQRIRNEDFRMMLDNIEIGRIERFNFVASPILPALTVTFRRPRR